MNYWSLIISIFISISCLGQPKILFQETLQKAPQGFYIDHLGARYLQKKTELIKYDDFGIEIGRFSLPNADTITSINTFNPLSVLVFFKTYNTLVRLDNQLNVRGQVLQLDDFGLVDVTTMAAYDEERIWLFDKAQMKIFLINTQTNTIEQESLFLGTLLNSIEGNTQIISTFDKLFLGIEGQGIFQLNTLLAFERKIPKTNWKFLQAKNGLLYIHGSEKLAVLNLKTGKETYIEYPIPLPDQSVIEQNRLALRKGKQIFIFEIL